MSHRGNDLVSLAQALGQELTGPALERLADQVKRELRLERKAVKRCILCNRPLPKTARKSSKKR